MLKKVVWGMRIILIASGLFSVQAEEYFLMKDGRSACEIIVPENAPDHIQFAAKELSTFLAKIANGKRPAIIKSATGARYPISFLVAAVSSAILDGANAVCAAFPTAMPVRILCYTVGFLIMTLGIALMAECGLPVAPMNLFVRELAEEREKPFRRVKLIFDIVCLILSITISLCFTGGISKGIGMGTIAAAFLTGPLSGVYIAFLRRHIRFI